MAGIYLREGVLVFVWVSKVQLSDAAVYGSSMKVKALVVEGGERREATMSTRLSDDKKNKRM
jgi:hypothetical protein